MSYFSGKCNRIADAIQNFNYRCHYPLAACNPIDCKNNPHLIDASAFKNHKHILDLSECPSNCYFQIHLQNTIYNLKYEYTTPSGAVQTIGIEHFPYKSAGADVLQIFQITSGFNTVLEISDNAYFYDTLDDSINNPYLIGGINDNNNTTYSTIVGSDAHFISFAIDLVNGEEYLIELDSGDTFGVTQNGTGAQWGSFFATGNGTAIFTTKTLQPNGFTVTINTTHLLN